VPIVDYYKVSPALMVEWPDRLSIIGGDVTIDPDNKSTKKARLTGLPCARVHKRDQWVDVWSIMIDRWVLAESRTFLRRPQDFPGPQIMIKYEKESAEFGGEIRSCLMEQGAELVVSYEK